jgi:6-phosphogluconolactonase (cycloisomerase 2 family)
LRSGDTVHEAHVLVVGAVLLISVRGCDVIAVFDVGGDGIPTYRASFDSGGQWPRHFAVAGEQLVVGNEKSHGASIFDLADVLSVEATSGAIAVLPHTSIRVPSPACVAFG